MENIKNIANRVFKEMGAGFSERAYHNAMNAVLNAQGINFKTECTIPVMVENTEVSKIRADLVIDNTVVVELKCSDRILNIHSTQCFMYMKHLKINDGLIVKFPKLNNQPVEFQELNLEKYLESLKPFDWVGLKNAVVNQGIKIMDSLKGVITSAVTFKTDSSLPSK